MDMVEPVDEHLPPTHHVNRCYHSFLFTFEVPLFNQGREGFSEQVTVEEILCSEEAFAFDF